MMEEIDYKIFRNYLLKMTNLLVAETALLIDERPRFAHSVLVLADNDPTPGERVKANYLMQLDPLWNFETNSSSAFFEKEKINSKFCKKDQISKENYTSQNELTKNSHKNLNQKNNSSWQNEELISDLIDRSLLNSNNSMQFDENNNNFILNKCNNQSKKSNQQKRLPSLVKRSIISSPTLDSIKEVLTPTELISNNHLVETNSHSTSTTNCIEKLKNKMPLNASINEKPSNAWLSNQYTQKEKESKRLYYLQTNQNEISNTYKYEKPNFSIQKNISENDKRNEKRNENIKLTPNIANNLVIKQNNFIQTIKNNNETKGNVNIYKITKPQFQTTNKINMNDNNVEKKIYRRNKLEYETFPSEKREQYARWKTNCKIDSSENLTPYSDIRDSKTAIIETKNSILDDPFINEALMILEKAYSMISDTTNQINEIESKNNESQANLNDLNQSFHSFNQKQLISKKNKINFSNVRFPSETSRFKNLNRTTNSTPYSLESSEAKYNYQTPFETIRNKKLTKNY